MRTSIAVTVLLAGLAGAAQAATLQQLIDRHDRLDVACRGGAGNDPATDRACEAREAVSRQIRRRGFCLTDPVVGFHRC